MFRKALLAGLMIVSMVQAANAKEGFYLGGQIPYNMVGGDFDDKSAPKVDPGIGIGLIAGYTFVPSFSLEVDWSGSSHKSGSSTIGFGELSLNAKYSLLTTELQPYLLAGIGSFALGDDSLTFGGTGYNLGFGADFYATPNVSFGVGIFRKLITYDKILKSDPGLVLLKNIKGDTTSIRFDVTYHF